MVLKNHHAYLPCYAFCLLLCIGASHTATISTTHDVSITVTPPTMHAGFTRDLHLNCSFHHGNDSDFRNLMSIILSKTSAVGEPTYSELASIASVSPDNVKVKDDMGAHVTGQLTDQGTSYISYKWTYPTSQALGSYKCEAFGMDNDGHPRGSIAVVEVEERGVDLDDLLEKIKYLEINQSQQKIQLANQATMIGDQKHQLSDQQNQLSDQKLQLSDLQSRVNHSQSAVMETSATYRGHTYFLSRPFVNNQAMDDAMCRLFGGYLAEVNDEQEFDFVYDFVKNAGTVSGNVHFDGTDIGHEGTWTSLYSTNQSVYLKWAHGQPAALSSVNCLGIDIGSARGMHDLYCTGNYFSRFVCEIP